MKVIALINFKGGVTKTTTSTNIASVLSTKNKRVLIIDTDPQGNCSLTINCKSYSSNTVYDVLDDANYDIFEAIYETPYENLMLCPASKDIGELPVRIAMNSKVSQQYRLFKQLKKVKDKFDYCIIDCAPGETVITTNVLSAADIVYIPVVLDKYSMSGVEQIIDSIIEVKDEFNPKLRIGGIIVNCFDRRLRASHEKFLTLKVDYPELYIEHYIGVDEKVKKAMDVNKPVIFYDKNAKATKDYIKFVEEVIL